MNYIANMEKEFREREIIDNLIYLQKKEDGSFRTIKPLKAEVSENMLKVQKNGSEYVCKSLYDLREFLYGNVLLGYPTDDGLVPLAKDFGCDASEPHAEYPIQTSREKIAEIYADPEIQERKKLLFEYIDGIEALTTFLSDMTQDEVSRLEKIPVLLRSITTNIGESLGDSSSLHNGSEEGDSAPKRLHIKQPSYLDSEQHSNIVKKKR